MRLVFDIEANGLYWDVDEVYCIVAYDIDTKAVHKFSPKNIWEGVKLLFSADTLIGHNIVRYDIPVLEKLYSKKFTGKTVDTLIISRLMYPDIRQNPMGGNGLKQWGKFLNNNKISFDDWTHYSQEMMDYCVQDVLLNKDILLYQTEYYKANKKIIEFEHLVAKICFNQEISGFGYDLEAGKVLEQHMLVERAELLDHLQTVFPDIVEERWSEKSGKRLKDKTTPFNPQSGKQVYSRLVERYPHIEPDIEWNELTDKQQRDKDAGKDVEPNPKMDSFALKRLDDKHNIEEIKAIITYRDNLKLYGQVCDWNERAENSVDGRIHGEVNTQGAGSGRCTHANPNVAQVASDPRMRALWCPGLKDYVQVGVDLSGLELRMLAHYMAEYDGGAYAKEILDGDIHTANQEAAGLPSRNDAKKFIYSFLYGAGIKKMASDLGISHGKMTKMKKNFLERLPALEKVIKDVHTDYHFEGTVQLPDGRWVQCRTEHAALNTKLQGAGAIVSKYWMVVADARLRAEGIRFIQMAYVHDEVQYAVHKDDAERACKIITDASLEAGERLGIKMPVHSEADIGANWKDCH